MHKTSRHKMGNWYASSRVSEQHVMQSAATLHILLTAASTLGFVDVNIPFATAVFLCASMFFLDRTIYFLFPGLILMTLGFLSPLILSDAPVALKSPPNGAEYDRDMIISFYWFIGIFSFYVPAANAVQTWRIHDTRVGKSDLVPLLSAMILLVFSALMLQNGTLFTGGYRDVTEQRFGFIEFASLATLVGFCAARSRVARNILIVAVAVYLATTFLAGLRLRFISVATVLFCCTVGTRIHSGWKIAGMLSAIMLFLLGRVRNAGFVGISLSDAFSFQNMYIQGTLVSTSGGAFQTSKFHAYYVKYIASENGLNGLHFLIGDILSIFLTRGGLPDALEIKAQTSRFFDVPGGGLLPGYFYAYLGIGGAIVLSALFTMVFIFVLRRRHGEAFPYQVILAAYAPRMLLYDWTVAFKMMFYFLILKLILSFLANASQAETNPRHLPTQRSWP